MMKKLIVLLIVVMIVGACGNGEPKSSTEFIIKNNTSHYIELEAFDASMPNQNPKDVTLVITPNSETSYYYSNWGEEPFDYLPFGATVDSVYIIFNDNAQIIYKQNDLDERNILDRNNWNEVIESESYHKYTYIITDEDYENAVIIN